MTGARLQIKELNLAYGAQPILRGIDLDIQPGEFFAFLGPSGCGKTTLLRVIAGFAQAQSGQVLLDGQDIAAKPPWKRDVGLVFQSYALWPHMTVRQNVAFGLEERRLPRKEVAARVEEALRLVDLRHLADRRPSELSGGQQQRVAVARTVAIRPKLLLLDEPLSNLDAKLRVQVRRELRELQQSLGLTTIFVTHDQEEANTTCDRIAVMSDGIVQQVATPTELYARPANLFVAGFMGTANILDGAAFGRPGRHLLFRPQDASMDGSMDGSADGRMEGTPDTAQSGAITLYGQVTHREFLGTTMRYLVRTGTGTAGKEVAVDQSFRAGASPIEPGAAVMIVVPDAAALWLDG